MSSPARTVPPPLHIALCAAGTPFLDGFSTASAAFVITLLPKLSGLETGLFTSIYFVGFAAGALIGGALADRFGRRPLFLASMAGIGAASLLGAWLDALAVLLAVRLVTGFLLGGDYPAGQALVTELTPEKERSRSLTLLMFGWYAGAIFAVLLACPILSAGLSASAFFLAEAVIALALLWGRTGVPESRGAREHPAEKPAAHAETERTGMPERPIAGDFLFCTAFWLCQTIPATVLMFYSAQILTDLIGSSDAYLQVLLLYAAFLIGMLPAAAKPFTRHPRRVLIGTFLVMAAALAALALESGMGSRLLTGAAFILFALAYSLQTPLDFVYPNLLFPDHCRARLVGMITTITRAGTMLTAFVFPLFEERFPVSAFFGWGTGILLFGAALSLFFAPPEQA